MTRPLPSARAALPACRSRAGDLRLGQQPLAELVAHLRRHAEALGAGAALDHHLLADGDGRQGVEGHLALGVEDRERS